MLLFLPLALSVSLAKLAFMFKLQTTLASRNVEMLFWRAVRHVMITIPLMAMAAHPPARFNYIITALTWYWATVAVLPALPFAMSAAITHRVPTAPPITHMTALIISALLIAHPSLDVPHATIQHSLIALPAMRDITSLQDRLKAASLSVETESEYLLRDVTTITTQMEMAVLLPAQSKMVFTV
jgi:hypothetical protein